MWPNCAWNRSNFSTVLIVTERYSQNYFNSYHFHVCATEITPVYDKYVFAYWTLYQVAKLIVFINSGSQLING